MASPWTHSLCLACWTKRNPSREPRCIEATTERCCACGEWHRSGIWTRADPAEFACRGQGPTHQGDEESAGNMLALQVAGRILTLPLTEEGRILEGGHARYSGLESCEAGAFLARTLASILGDLSQAATSLPGTTAVVRLIEPEARDAGFAVRDQIAAIVGGPFVAVVPTRDGRGADLYAKGTDGPTLRKLLAFLLAQAEGLDLREGSAIEVVSLGPPRGDA